MSEIEELKAGLESGELKPEDLTDEQYTLLKENTYVTLADIEMAILMIDEENGPAIFAAISEAMAMLVMVRDMTAMYEAGDGYADDNLSKIFGF